MRTDRGTASGMASVLENHEISSHILIAIAKNCIAVLVVLVMSVALNLIDFLMWHVNNDA